MKNVFLQKNIAVLRPLLEQRRSDTRAKMFLRAEKRMYQYLSRLPRGEHAGYYAQLAQRDPERFALLVLSCIYSENSFKCVLGVGLLNDELYIEERMSVPSFKIDWVKVLVMLFPRSFNGPADIIRTAKKIGREVKIPARY